MRRYVFVYAWLIGFTCNAQTTLTPGQYQPEGGSWPSTLSVNKDNSITIAEPNGYVITYDLEKENVYLYVHTNGVEYRVSALTNSSFKAYKNDPSNFTRYVLAEATGESTRQPVEEAIDYLKVAEEYKVKMKTDPANVQVYSFCAAAAMARAIQDNESYEAYARKVSASLKSILVDAEECPCEDAIPESIWNAMETQ